MGGGRGSRGGKGKGKSDDAKTSWTPSSPSGRNKQGHGDDEWHEDEGWDEWNGDKWEEPKEKRQPPAALNSFAQQSSTSWVPQCGLQTRQLASQWRFACRVLQRHGPEERVHDARSQINLGDHVFVQYSWDFGESHGVICSAEDGGRRNTREDPHWVVHWTKDNAKLQCTSLSQFSKGGELFRVSYPQWVCECCIPETTTKKPYIAAEHFLEADRPEAIAKRANTAFKNGNWSSSWSQAPDVEFCIQTVTGSSSPVEIHARKTLATTFKWPVGCAIGGDRKPSLLFGVGKAGGAGGASSPGRAPPGYAAMGRPTTEPPPMPPQGFGAPPMWPGSQEQGWSGGGWQGAPAVQIGLAGALQNKSLSAEAQEFVPAPAPSWDGIYQ